jgi:hypothetical protein
LEYRLPTWREETGISGDALGYSYIDARDFRFPFGDYFGPAIDNHGDKHMVLGEGMNYQSPVRPVTLAEDKA